MIIGIGTDLVEVDHIEHILSKSERFRTSVFTEQEIIYCEAQLRKYEHYAARFAAKEAFVKALGTGFSKGISWKDIEIGKMPDRNPVLQLSGKCARITTEKGVLNMFVSLTHTQYYASAFVILEN